MFSHKTLAALTLVTIAALNVYSNTAEAQARRVAQAAPAAQPAQGEQGGDKLDVSDLERKYWAAKDTDFSVVQNRLFSKANRFGLSLNYGTLLNESWTEAQPYGASLAYYFSERYGVELAYNKIDAKDNQATDILKQQSGYPDHNNQKTFYGVSFNWVPFYAKMSVLNSTITYFDMAISPGIGVTEYEQIKEEGNVTKTAPTLTLDVTQHYFLNKYFAVRLDYKNRWFNEDIAKYRLNGQPAGSERKVSTDLKHTSILMFGLTLYY